MKPVISNDRRSWGRLVSILMGFKFAYLGVVLLTVNLGSEYNQHRANVIHRQWFPEGWPQEAEGELERHFTTWDA